MPTGTPILPPYLHLCLSEKLRLVIGRSIDQAEWFFMGFRSKKKSEAKIQYDSVKEIQNARVLSPQDIFPKRLYSG